MLEIVLIMFILNSHIATLPIKLLISHKIKIMTTINKVIFKKIVSTSLIQTEFVVQEKCLKREREVTCRYWKCGLDPY